MSRVSMLLVAGLAASAAGAAVKWTGIVNDQQWTTANNWYPAKVPGPNDDVTIDDAEGKDATVVLVQPMSVGSLTIGNEVSNAAHLRVLSGLTVARGVSVQTNGKLEINSGAASVSTGNLMVAGELAFLAGTLTGNATITGKANFGEQSAKVFDAATVSIRSAQPVVASGSVQFKSGSTVTATSGIQSSGNNFQLIVMDSSTKNSFTAQGFSWAQ